MDDPGAEERMLQESLSLPDGPASAAATRDAAAEQDAGAAPLPALGEQKDIRYHAAAARSVLNAPAATGMPFWSVNPYVGCAFGCAYCYARYAHRYTVERAQSRVAEASASPFGDAEPLPPWLAFERRILVKENAAELLRRALRPGSRAHSALVVRGEPVVIGTATDPYQPAERRYRVTQQLLQALAEQSGLRVSIITKSPLVTRDVPLLQALARRSTLSVHVSLITLDRALARRVEPRAPTPDSRLRAVRRLAAAGIDVGVNCMPVLPGLTDRPAALRALVAAVAAAGATHVAAGALRLRAAARQRYLPWLAESFPELSARYRLAYAAGHQPGDAYREALRQLMSRLCAEHGLPTLRHYDERRQREASRLLTQAAERDLVPALQLSLGL